MNTEMKIFETEIKDIQELQAKARKYDELKEAVEKIKEEIRETYDEFRDNDVLIANGITMCNRIIKKHTEGLI